MLHGLDGGLKMERREVPQDRERSTYGGHRKLVYAMDEDGHYTGVQSAGWEAESEATRMAIEEFEALRDKAWLRAHHGLSSPLEVHMYDRRMDVAVLAGASGLSRWRVRRHFHPRRFARLPQRILRRYAEALGLDIATLKQLPPRRNGT